MRPYWGELSVSVSSGHWLKKTYHITFAEFHGISGSVVAVPRGTRRGLANAYPTADHCTRMFKKYLLALDKRTRNQVYRFPFHQNCDSRFEPWRTGEQDCLVWERFNRY